jgi:hypothetical protein
LFLATQGSNLPPALWQVKDSGGNTLAVSSPECAPWRSQGPIATRPRGWRGTVWPAAGHPITPVADRPPIDLPIGPPCSGHHYNTTEQQHNNAEQQQQEERHNATSCNATQTLTTATTQKPQNKNNNNHNNNNTQQHTTPNPERRDTTRHDTTHRNNTISTAQRNAT